MGMMTLFSVSLFLYDILVSNDFDKSWIIINFEFTGFVWKIDENWTKDDVLHYLCEQRLKNYAPRLLPKIHKVRNLVY